MKIIFDNHGNQFYHFETWDLAGNRLIFYIPVIYKNDTAYGQTTI